MFDTLKKKTMSCRRAVIHSFYKSGSSRLETCRDDSSLLNSTVRGFTLIELLVVVLIIGILASVALPQYQLAVEKSRAATVIPMIKAIGTAEQLYFLANNEYTNDIDLLDLSFNKDTSATNVAGLGKLRVNFSRLSNDPPYIYGHIHDSGHADNNHYFFIMYVLTTGEMYCEAHNTATDLIKRVCKSLGKQVEACPKNNGTAATCYKIS